MKYSIWIIPPQSVSNELSKIINDLSRKYKGPVFQPHMTLLGSIEEDVNKIYSTIKKSLIGLDRLVLSLGPISFSTTYFQSVFVRINSTAPLMNLNINLKKLLNIENNVFMPHISLLYGNHDMKTREKITTEIQLHNSSFMAHKLVIIPVKPKPSEWKPIATIPF